MNLAIVRHGTASSLESRPDPTLRSGQALARILRAGLCGTDLQIQRGIRPDGASILGHEGLAEISSESTGQRGHYIFSPVHPTRQDRILGHSYDGIFQQLLVTDEDVPGTVPAHNRLIADLSPLVEPLACVLYGWELVGKPHGPVGIWGAGVTAILAALVAELHGTQPYLIHPRPERLRFLADREIFTATSLKTQPPKTELAAALVCLPREAAPAALSEALSVLQPGGFVDLFGGFGPGDRHPVIPGVDLGAVRRANVCGHPRPGVAVPVGSVKLTGHRGTAPRHLENAQQLLLTHPKWFAPLITHVLSLETAASNIARLAMRESPTCGPDERIKVVIDMTMQGDACRSPDLSTTITELGANKS